MTERTVGKPEDGSAPRASIASTLAFVRPAAGRLTVAALLGAGAIAAAIGLLAVSAWLLSRAALHPGQSALALAIVLVQLLALSRGLLRYGERLVSHDAAFRLLGRSRVRCYRQLERLAPSGLVAFRDGDVLARVVGDVDSLQDLVLRVVQPFAVALLVGVATVAFVWTLLPAAGIVLLVALALAATVVPWLTGALARRGAADEAAVRGELAASVADLVEGGDELAVYGATDVQLAHLEDLDRTLGAVGVSHANTAGVGLALTTLCTGLATWGALVVGVPVVHAGRLSGVWLAPLALIPLAAFELVSGLPVATQTLQSARERVARLFAIDATPDPVPEPAAAVDPPVPPVAVEVRGLTVTYPGATRPALRGVDLRLAPGRRVAVVGRSGAGKSTLASVLVGFVPVGGGDVTLDGVPVDLLRGDALRRLVGMVGQDAHLFDTTLAANLRIGRVDATDADLSAVLDRVGLGPFLDGLPDGLATEVGRFGTRLSGGQRQRIAVARGLLADFPVLVLDEPAEHLDAAAADELAADLLTWTVGRSTLLITHRLAGLEAVDEIVVLEDGLVVERGSHDVLLATGGTYADLWWNERRNDLALDASGTPSGSCHTRRSRHRDGDADRDERRVAS